MKKYLFKCGKNISKLSFEDRLLFFANKGTECANNPLISLSSREIHRHMAKTYQHSLKMYRETHHVKPRSNSKTRFSMIDISLLSRFYNFIRSRQDRKKAEYIEENAQKYVLAWVPVDDCPSGSIWIGAHHPCFERMVDPLADPDKKDTEKQQEGVNICDALKFNDKRSNCSEGAKYYEYVIPMLYLKAGEQFIHCASRIDKEMI